VPMAVFSKCANTLQEGKRLENLSWRIYSRETFCCSPAHRSDLQSLRRNSSDHSLPELSSSFDSRSSLESNMGSPNSNELASRFSSLTASESGRKHITPIDLENIVKSVTESKEITPLSPLPQSLRLSSEHLKLHPTEEPPQPAVTSIKQTEELSSPKLNPESSTSTMATTGSEGSQLSTLLDDSTATEVSGTSIVRGFSKENISRSRMSRTQLAPPPTTYRASPQAASPAPMNPRPLKKRPVFLLGGSEGDESSPDSQPSRSFLSEGLRLSSRKTASFREDVELIRSEMGRAEEAIDDSDDDEPSGSAIEDDDDWEDEPESSAQADGSEIFQRIDSQTNLTSRRSLITTQMHEKDRAAMLQNLASRSTPAIRRRTSSHNGPLNAMASNDHVQLSRARPINVTSPQPAEDEQLPPSPRTNRRKMLATELTGSLRKHLLWERQHRNPAGKQLKNRSYRSEIRLNERGHQPYFGSSEGPRRNDSLNFYENGLPEYFEKGW
jgi:uncharacterized protein DUF3295/uncharacterized protein DUF1752